MNKVLVVGVIGVVLFSIDYYVFQAIKTVTISSSGTTSQYIKFGFWGLSIISFLGLIAYHLLPAELVGKNLRTAIMVWLFIFYFSKAFVLQFLIIDDLRRGAIFIINKIHAGFIPVEEGKGITRSEFLSKVGLFVAAIPFVSLIYGVVSGGHDYKVITKKITLKNLPNSFKGLRIAQISDIHSGSFYNKEAVEKGIKMLTQQNADVVFFTGDLVNNKADEMIDYMETFKKVQAPMGVYSVLGNHDYGDYHRWNSPEDKAQNLNRLKETHGELGWRLLMNEHIMLERENEKIAVLGIENWGAKGNFPKYGSMKRAYQGSESAPVKLLLSHDPSHWDAEVRQQYKDIDIMFAGHTHGLQFGVEIGDFKWSPVKYMYKQWAGLYQQADQFLYVNRGFGFLGYPGRVGIWPEITIIELDNA